MSRVAAPVASTGLPPAHVAAHTPVAAATNGANPATFDEVDREKGNVSPIPTLIPVSAFMEQLKEAGQHAKPYQILGPLGKGHFAMVYKAQLGDELYALKKVAIFEMMNQASRDKCLKEIQLLQSLNHQNIIRYEDSYIDHQTSELVIVLQWARGGDLKKLIKKVKSGSAKITEFSEGMIWKYCAELSSGLNYMHEKRVLHRDLKPANVFLTHDNHVLLGDLGLSRYFNPQTMEAYTKCGTPLYISPEVLMGTGYGFAADVWSLGCILYELCTLSSPFKPTTEGVNLYALFGNIRSGKFEPIPANGKYSENLRMLIAAMIRVDASQRPTMLQVQEVAKKMVEARLARQVQAKEEQQKQQQLYAAQQQQQQQHQQSSQQASQPQPAPTPEEKQSEPSSSPSPSPEPPPVVGVAPAPIHAAVVKLPPPIDTRSPRNETLLAASPPDILASPNPPQSYAIDAPLSLTPAKGTKALPPPLNASPMHQSTAVQDTYQNRPLSPISPIEGAGNDEKMNHQFDSDNERPSSGRPDSRRQRSSSPSRRSPSPSRSSSSSAKSAVINPRNSGESNNNAQPHVSATSNSVLAAQPLATSIMRPNSGGLSRPVSAGRPISAGHRPTSASQNNSAAIGNHADVATNSQQQQQQSSSHGLPPRPASGTRPASASRTRPDLPRQTSDPFASSNNSSANNSRPTSKQEATRPTPASSSQSSNTTIGAGAALPPRPTSKGASTRPLSGGRPTSKGSVGMDPFAEHDNPFPSHSPPPGNVNRAQSPSLSMLNPDSSNLMGMLSPPSIEQQSQMHSSGHRKQRTASTDLNDLTADSNSAFPDDEMNGGQGGRSFAVNNGGGGLSVHPNQSYLYDRGASPSPTKMGSVNRLGENSFGDQENHKTNGIANHFPDNNGHHHSGRPTSSNSSISSVASNFQQQQRPSSRGNSASFSNRPSSRDSGFPQHHSDPFEEDVEPSVPMPAPKAPPQLKRSISSEKAAEAAAAANKSNTRVKSASSISAQQANFKNSMRLPLESIIRDEDDNGDRHDPHEPLSHDPRFQEGGLLPPRPSSVDAPQRPQPTASALAQAAAATPFPPLDQMMENLLDQLLLLNYENRLCASANLPWLTRDFFTFDFEGLKSQQRRVEQEKRSGVKSRPSSLPATDDSKPTVPVSLLASASFAFPTRCQQLVYLQAILIWFSSLLNPRGGGEGEAAQRVREEVSGYWRGYAEYRDEDESEPIEKRQQLASLMIELLASLRVPLPSITADALASCPSGERVLQILFRLAQAVYYRKLHGSVIISPIALRHYPRFEPNSQFEQGQDDGDDGLEVLEDETSPADEIEEEEGVRDAFVEEDDDNNNAMADESLQTFDQQRTGETDAAHQERLSQAAEKWRTEFTRLSETTNLLSFNSSKGLAGKGQAEWMLRAETAKKLSNALLENPILRSNTASSSTTASSSLSSPSAPSAPSSVTPSTLSNRSADLRRALEKIARFERNLQGQSALKPIAEEHAQLRSVSDRMSEDLQELEISKAEGVRYLEELEIKVAEIMDQMERHKNGREDESGLRKLRTTLASLKTEIKQFNVQIGVKSRMLLQFLQMKHLHVKRAPAASSSSSGSTSRPLPNHMRRN